ncbi:hypothetical protein PENTCL1PPCAC_19712 [Pristionchus entomophagus]|uniref:Metalloendopeptidase n=1 Tax=Pristionchus entomophagus TaxID=358040 RepID=A0AAV5TTI6_9BILA|nr:hypothetical protein PENTCL1PPCAC_19712 [Pristionchus entomophagus]
MIGTGKSREQPNQQRRCLTIPLTCLFLISSFVTFAEARLTEANAAPETETFLSNDDFERPLDDDQVFLNETDFAAGEKISKETPAQSHFLSKQLFHRGDIRGKASWRLKTSRVGARRNGVISGIKKWPNARIPYALSAKYNDRERAVLARSFSEYQKRTCVKFVPRTALDNDYLYIGKIDGCYSDVGRAGGRQELSLDDGCLQYDTAIHELMHSVGFYHEHERWDRDEHITILWHNIDRDAYDQFGKVDLSESSYYGQAYDYHSVMHYDSLAFSKNGFETMIAKRPEMTKVIGSAIDFSPVDILKINLMYSCAEQLAASGVVTPTNLGTFSSLGSGGLPAASLIPQPAIIPSPGIPPPMTALGGTPTAVVDGTGRLPIITQITGVPKGDITVDGGLTKPSEGGDECRDRTNLCWRWLDRCRSFFFEKIMREFCAASCGFCTPGLPSIASAPKVARSEAPSSVPVYRQFG